MTIEEWGWADLAAIRRRRFYADPRGHRDLDQDAIIGASGEVALASFLQRETGARALHHWAITMDRDESDGKPDLYQYHVGTCRHYGRRLLARRTSTRDGKWGQDDVLVMARLAGPWDPINRPHVDLVGWIRVGQFLELAEEFDDDGATGQARALGVQDDQLGPMNTLPMDMELWEEWLYHLTDLETLSRHTEDMNGRKTETDPALLQGPGGP